MKCEFHNIALVPVAQGGSALHCQLCTDERSIAEVHDLDLEAWLQIKQAMKESPWIPNEYVLNDVVADICRFLRTPHDHSCRCGTSTSDHGHETGHLGCVRSIVDAPVAMENSMWLVGGHLITDFTLRQQRGYHQHPCGCWSSHGDSYNSLEGDW